MAAQLGVRTAPAFVAHRLQALGWLLRTGLSGAWEFAPGAHAGPHSRGGPLLPVKAALALMPELPAAVALTLAVKKGCALLGAAGVLAGLLLAKVLGKLLREWRQHL